MVPMTVYMFGQGLVMPNATAAAMAPHGRAAGVVSSVMGCLRTGGGALRASLREDAGRLTKRALDADEVRTRLPSWWPAAGVSAGTC